jgi:hypothetical protein
MEIVDAPVGYQPGVCNIGSDEIAYRRRAGYLGLAIAMGLAVALVIIDAPAWARLLVAFPLGGGILSLWQARSRFCAGFGLAGVENFDERSTANVKRIEDPAARAADRARALRMFAISATAGLVIAGVFALLPS